MLDEVEEIGHSMTTNDELRLQLPSSELDQQQAEAAHRLLAVLWECVYLWKV